MAVSRFWKWVLGLGVPGLIAAPVIESLVNTGALPAGLAAFLSTLGTWFSALWGWLNTEVLIPHWLVLIVAILLVALAASAVWFIWPIQGVDRRSLRGQLYTLSGDQLKVFMLVGLAADDGGVVTLGQVIKNEKLSRNAAQFALEQLLHHDLIKYGFYPGDESYDLTSEGRRLYLERERAVGA